MNDVGSTESSKSEGAGFAGAGAGTSLEGKTAVITGASRGIGAALARMLHQRGVNLGLASRSGDDLGLDGVIAQHCDVRSLEDLVAICDATAERFGGIDIVVPNAGVGAYGPFLDLSLEHLDEMIDVNFKGTVYAVRAALPHMLGREGDVLTVASEAGRRGLPYEAVYCGSKFGQVGFTAAMDHELRERGIRCTNICPGGVATDFALDEGRGRTEDALPGMMTAEDVAEVCVFALERPRRFRILETAFRPMTEASWG
jgi:3-oxoacyl-[acyl-carrier protein] reductase